LALSEFFWLGRQTPWRHFDAEGKFLFLFSSRHLHPHQYRHHAFELVIQALSRTGVRGVQELQELQELQNKKQRIVNAISTAGTLFSS
jgi:hypothetical protein